MSIKVQKPIVSLGGISLAEAIRVRDNVSSMKGYDVEALFYKKPCVKRSTRKTRKPRRFADEKFLPCTNNGYTAGRRIDPGFAIDGRTNAPFDNWAIAYHVRVNENSRAPVYVDEEVEDDDEVEDEGEEWMPSGDESEESGDESEEWDEDEW